MLPDLPDDVLLSRQQLSKLLGISLQTAKRLKADGPPEVLISRRRIGYRVKDVRAWIASRTRDGRA
jgi:predicted DNA-binding transcriptional regulator AlpA